MKDSKRYCNFIVALIMCGSTWVSIEAVVNRSETLTLSEKVTQHKAAEVLDQVLHAKDHLGLHENLLQASSISYGIAQVANSSLISNKCFEHLVLFKQNILLRKTWAMKALDASGTKPAGFIFWNNFWFGSSETCDAANMPLGLTLIKRKERTMKPDLIDDVSPFELTYNVVMLKHNSPWQFELSLQIEPVLHVGLCLPASCTTDEIQQLMEKAIGQKFLLLTELYEFRPKTLYVKDLKLKDEFFQRTSLKILAVLLIFTSVMMSTAYFIHAKQSALEGSNQISSNDSGDHRSVRNESEMFYGIKSYTNCFNISANWQKLFAIQPSHDDAIPVINGLRSVSAFSVLCAHVAYFIFFKMQNFLFFVNFHENSSLQLFNIPFYLVDIFFAISGFLLTYKFLKNTQKMEEIRKNTFMRNVWTFLQWLFHRYLRLAPLYFVTIAVTDLVTAYLNDVAVFHINERYHETCPRNWWHNVLFIQSFFGLNELCLSWTWSLSCEMQYFVVATLLLFIYTKHPKLIKNIVIVLLAANIVGSLLLGTSVKYQFAIEAFYLAVEAMYINSLVRVLPYLVGSIAAWYFIEHECMRNVNPFVEKFLWKLSAFLLVTVTYTGYWRDLGYLASTSLLTLGHGVTAFSVCWLIMASATGRNTVWSRFLEAPVFQHINRLTYAIYLLSPMIINLFASLNEKSTYLNTSMFVIYCLGFSVLVYLVAIVFSLAFEMPYCNLSSLILKRNKTKTL